MANAIRLAVKQQADVINCSWSDQNGQIQELHSEQLESAIDSAINYGRNGKGCVVVFAAGNYHYMVEYPGNYRKEILTVGASTQQYKRWENSGMGSANGDNLDVMAHGDNIYSTSTDYTGYNSEAGTSYAAPHVSGIAALMLSVNPNLTGQQVRDIIETTA